MLPSVCRCATDLGQCSGGAESMLGHAMQVPWGHSQPLLAFDSPDVRMCRSSWPSMQAASGNILVLLLGASCQRALACCCCATCACSARLMSRQLPGKQTSQRLPQQLRGHQNCPSRSVLYLKLGVSCCSALLQPWRRGQAAQVQTVCCHLWHIIFGPALVQHVSVMAHRHVHPVCRT